MRAHATPARRPRRHGSGLALTTVCALVACAASAPTTPPAVPVEVPATWSRADVDGAQSLARWWLAFDDALLSRLVERARVAATDVVEAQARWRSARALREAAAAALRPTLTLTASARRSHAEGVADRRIDTGFDASWDLDAAGSARHAVAASEADAQAAGATLAAARLAVAAEVALAYLQLRAAQVRAAIAREHVASLQHTLQIAQWRELAGLVTSLDVAQARSAVEQARAQTLLLEASAAQSTHAIAVLSGDPPAAWLAELAPAAPLPQPTRGAALAVPAQVLRERPDVRAAELQLVAAAERVGQADAARRPTLQLQASLAWTALTIGSLGSTAAARSLLAVASQPLVDGGRRDAQWAAQRAAFDAAEQAYRARVLAALQDVEDALAVLASARERVAALSAAAQDARRAALLAEDRYASGLVDFQIVLDAQRTQLSVQDGAASAQADLAAGHVRLYRALGGGWQPDGDDAEDSR